MGVGRSKGDEGGGAMGYFNLICKIWDYKINDQTKMHAESSISCGRSHFTTTSLPLTMRSWLDRDLWGSPTVCKSGRSRSTASSDCTTKDRCWWTRRRLQGFAICTTSRITQTVSFCNWTRTDEVALNKMHLKNLFSVLIRPLLLQQTDYYLSWYTNCCWSWHQMTYYEEKYVLYCTLCVFCTHHCAMWKNCTIFEVFV